MRREAGIYGVEGTPFSHASALALPGILIPSSQEERLAAPVSVPAM